MNQSYNLASYCSFRLKEMQGDMRFFSLFFFQKDVFTLQLIGNSHKFQQLQIMSESFVQLQKTYIFLMLAFLHCFLRSLRQYYKKGIMKKTDRPQRLVYQLCSPYHHWKKDEIIFLQNKFKFFVTPSKYGDKLTNL